LAIVLALPAVVLSARVNTARHEPQRVSDGVVAHASALMRKYTKHSMTDDEVRDVLAQDHELSDAVKAHLANVHSEDRSRKEEVWMKLRQRAQKGFAAAGIRLDKSVDGKDKTQCRCFIEKIKFRDNTLKLIDLDGEGNDYCHQTCFARCKSDEDKYKLDPGEEANALGAEITSPVAVAQCEGGECKCLDVEQSQQRIEQANGIMGWLDKEHQKVQIDAVHPPNGRAEFDSEEDCLRGCGASCGDFQAPGGIKVDLEAMCVDEWYSGGR